MFYLVRYSHMWLHLVHALWSTSCFHLVWNVLYKQSFACFLLGTLVQTNKTEWSSSAIKPFLHEIMMFTWLDKESRNPLWEVGQANTHEAWLCHPPDSGGGVFCAGVGLTVHWHQLWNQITEQELDYLLLWSCPGWGFEVWLPVLEFALENERALTVAQVRGNNLLSHFLACYSAIKVQYLLL